MATWRDKIKKVQKDLPNLYPDGFPEDITAFIEAARWPKGQEKEFKEYFSGAVTFYLKVRQYSGPEIVLWSYLHNQMLEIFNSWGHNYNRCWSFLKTGTGYDPKNPDEDWMAHRLTDVLAKSKKKRKEEGLPENSTPATDKEREKVDKKLCLLEAIPNTDFNELVLSRNIKDASEVDFLRKRSEEYNKDFVLNASADIAILNEIVMLELQLNRLSNYLKKYPNRTANKERADLFKQLCEAQRTLGVARESRIETEESARDTFSDAVETYENMLSHVYEMDILFGLEELEMLLQKYDRGESRGTKELDEYEFKRHTFGLTVAEGRAIYEANKHLMPEIEKKMMQVVL